jgi:hypothetical protein
MNKDFSKFVEFIGGDNIISIPSTPYHHKLFDCLVDKRKEINNSLAIPKEFLGKNDCSLDEFRTQYMLQPLRIGKAFKSTKRENRKERCGDCSFFGDKGCTTSYLEAKHGNKNTPACNEFSPKILGIKATRIIIDDPIK